MTQRSLDDLRREIDQIDDEIHGLIMRRAEVVAHVAGAKKGTKLPIRPSREASMLRRLKANHTGAFPISALARMWHEMMAAFTMIQSTYKIAVFAGEGYHTLWDLARDQFGSQVPMTAHDNRQEVMQLLNREEVDVAVLPPPEESEQDPWWTALASPGAPVIVQSLPFAGVGNVRGRPGTAVAVARLQLEETGDDVSFVVLRTPEQISRSSLVSSLKQQGLPAALLSTVEHHGEWLSLARIDGFVAPDDPRLDAVKSPSIVAATVIGAYARPIV